MFIPPYDVDLNGPQIPKANIGNLGHLVTRLSMPGAFGKTGIPIPRSGNVGVHGQGPLTSVLSFPGCPNDPQMLTATLYARTNLNAPDAGEGLVAMGNTGPLVCVAKWGSGESGQLFVEFDMPIGINASLVAPGQMGGDYGGGAVISVPGSQLEIGMRNDASLTPRAGDLSLGDTSDSNVFANSPTVSGNIGVGTRSPSTSLSRTIWAVNGTAGEVPIGLTPGNHVDVILPPFAQTFAVLRNPGLAIGVSQINQFGTEIDGPYAIPAGVPCPEMVLNNATYFIRVLNSDNALALLKVAVVYGLSI